MAAYTLTLERFDLAREHARDALAFACDADSEIYIVFALQHLAAVAAARAASGSRAEPEDHVNEDAERSARLIGFVDGRLGELAVTREFTEQQDYEKLLIALCGALGSDVFDGLALEGRQWAQARATAEAQRV